MTKILLALAAINLVTFAAFGWDKYCAERKMWRVPERTLLLLALFGGTVGAFAGRAFFRHKTRKEPFVTRLKLVAVLQSGLIGYAIWLWSRGELPL